MITADPLVLLTALAFLVPWAKVFSRLRCWFYQARLAVAVRRMERKHRCTVLVYAGHIHRGATVVLARRVRAAPIDRPLVLVLDTLGGEIPAAQHLLRALSSHPGNVIVRIPDECWSAGSVIACGADLILLGQDGNLGHTDVICPTDREQVRAGPTITAAERGHSIELVRSEHSMRDVAAAIITARVQRGMTVGEATALAHNLTMADADHMQPLFFEEAAALGLPVAVDPDLAWFHLVRLALRTR